MREGTCFEVCLQFLTKSWISIRILSVAEAMIQDLPQRIAESEVIEAFDFDRAFCVSILPKNGSEKKCNQSFFPGDAMQVHETSSTVTPCTGDGR